jgi:hypothetical protein
MIIYLIKTEAVSIISITIEAKTIIKMHLTRTSNCIEQWVPIYEVHKFGMIYYSRIWGNWDLTSQKSQPTPMSTIESGYNWRPLGIFSFVIIVQ